MIPRNKDGGYWASGQIIIEVFCEKSVWVYFVKWKLSRSLHSLDVFSRLAGRLIYSKAQLQGTILLAISDSSASRKKLLDDND